MSREKKLVKNTGILAVGQLSSKIFTFLLLPLYTSVLLPEDYGSVDALQTVMYLALYIITLQVESAVFRYIIDYREDDKDIAEYISSALILVGVNLLISTSVILSINLFFHMKYIVTFILCLWIEAIFLVFQNIARGCGDNIIYSVSSFAVTLVSLLLNLILILGFQIGAQSILIALVVSNAIGSVIIFFGDKLWRYISFKHYQKHRLTEMLQYSLPLVPNALSWWIAGASDRLLIVFFLGNAVNGIYAVANRIPIIYTTIFNVYSLAWTESMSLVSKDEDKENFINIMMEKSYKVFSFLALGIIASMSLFSQWLIGEQYADSYEHVYILMVAIFVNSICSLFGGILTGFKATRSLGTITFVGAIVNFLINLVFIRIIGLYAASISTLISNIVILLARKHECDKFIKIKFSISFFLQLSLVMSIVTVGYFVRNYILSLIILICLVVWGGYQNLDIMIEIIKAIKHKIK